ncbi:MAG: insulinase family protein [Chlamydiota bacterium]
MLRTKCLQLILLFLSFGAFLCASTGYEEIADCSTLTIRTPSLSMRKTAKIKLANGLQVFLISDPKAPQSAASLAMKTGMFSDPDDALGTAHFTEHLLFLGSKSYPEEHSYRDYIRNHNGRCNAYTTEERTVYTFSISNSAFQQALDRFAANFIDPLFSPEGIEREIHAIDQENNCKMASEDWRLFRVLKETANPHHPFSRFCIGNRETLKQLDRDAIIEWYQKHYSADIASLVVYSPLSVEDLTKLVVSCFGAMAQRKTSSYATSEPILSPKQKGTLMTIEPIDPNTRNLKVGWELPQDYASKLPKNKAHQLIIFLLKSYHCGSLFQQLEEAGWIDGLSAYCNRIGDQRAIFSVEFNLTLAGIDAVESIIETFYCYLNFIQSHPIPPFLIEEIKMMQQLDYEYQQRSSPFDYVESYAHSLANLDLARFPEQVFSFKSIEPTEVVSFLSRLTPKQAVYILTAPSSATQRLCDQKEPWFGTKYGIHPIADEKLAAWANAKKATFSLVEPTPLLPENLSLLYSEPSDYQQHPEPTPIFDGDEGKVYFWPDNLYCVPKVDMTFRLYSPLLDGTAKHTVLRDLFISALTKNTLSLSCQAARGGLSVAIKSSDRFNITLSLAGYSDKALDLLDALFDALISVKLTQETFSHQCSLLENLYAQHGPSDTDWPLDQAIDIANETLDLYPPYLKKQRALSLLTLADFTYFKKMLLQNVYLEALFAGNLTENDVRSAWKKALNKLNANPYPKKDHYRNELLLLSKANIAHKIYHETTAIGDAALLVLQGPPFSPANCAAHQVLKDLSQSFLNDLRTEKQMAYWLGIYNGYRDEHLLTYCYIQSTSHQAHKLLSQIDAFINDCIDRFEEVFSKERFENMRSSLIADLKKAPNNLFEMADSLELLAFDREGNFTRRAEVVAAMEKLSYDDVKCYAETYFSDKNKNRLGVIVRGEPPYDTAYTMTTPSELRKKLLPEIHLPWDDSVKWD